MITFAERDGVRCLRSRSRHRLYFTVPDGFWHASTTPALLSVDVRADDRRVEKLVVGYDATPPDSGLTYARPGALCRTFPLAPGWRRLVFYLAAPVFAGNLLGNGDFFFVGNEEVHIRAIRLRPAPRASRARSPLDTVHWMFRRILERSPTEAEMRPWAWALHRGDLSPTDLAGNLLLSEEFRHRFLAAAPGGRALEVLYRKTLGRQPDDQERSANQIPLMARDFDTMILDLIQLDEFEYRLWYGRQEVPHAD